MIAVGARKRRIAPRLSGLVVAMLLGFGRAAAPAHADEVDRLTKLMTSQSAKERLAAVTRLARVADKRALKPLVTVLGDTSPQVRTMAAAALGSLGHKAALPALRAAADEDRDANVRESARLAVSAITKANGLTDPASVAPVVAEPPKRSRRGGRAGFGSESRVIEPAAPTADLCVLVNSSSDESPGRTDKQTRKTHADIVRQTVSDQIGRDPLLTTVAEQAKQHGISARQLDLSVTKIGVQTVGNVVEVEAQLRLAISDDKGKMLSFLSGGAKVEVPRKSFDPRFLPRLRKEALEGAVRGMFDKLLVQLRDRSQS